MGTRCQGVRDPGESYVALKIVARRLHLCDSVIAAKPCAVYADIDGDELTAAGIQLCYAHQADLNSVGASGQRKIKIRSVDRGVGCRSCGVVSGCARI